MDGITDAQTGEGVDIASWAGLQLTDREMDKLWDSTTLTDLIEACVSADLVIDEEFDADAPGQSDTFYSVYTADEQKLAEELRKHILRSVKRSKRAVVKSARSA